MQFLPSKDELNVQFFLRPKNVQRKECYMKKVLLGMSGGVDSSVSAVLLKEQGYDVVGMTLELFGGTCCNTDAIVGAKQICNSIGIPHITYNLKEVFQCKVINNFIDEYSNQRTPNPCIECNKYMKFGAMYEKAKELGCDYIATGHYAKMEYSDEYGKYVLRKAKNLNKDQSYVLYNMPKLLLGKVLFPLGNFESKEDVRRIAKEHNLAVASKPDSEDICFIPDGNYKKFLEQNSNIAPKEGNIVNRKGEILGKHNGLYNYTIGQRKGLGISYKVPLFVIGFNKDKNELIVGEQEELYKKEMKVNEVNLLLMDKIVQPLDVTVKIRYASKPAEAIINQTESGNIQVIFKEPQRGITPGQSAVFYINDVVVGGGKIQ